MVVYLICNAGGFAIYLGTEGWAETWALEHARRHESVWAIPGTL